MQVSNLHRDKGKIPRHTQTLPTLFKLLDTLDIKKLWRYILELKQHRENKLQNVDNNISDIHQHVTNEVLKDKGRQQI